MASFERVGVIFVHGIGEQRRYEHLDAQLRDVVRAIELRRSKETPPFAVTVELRDGASAQFRSEENTWRMDENRAPVRAVVRDVDGTLERHLFFHEVWWADTNEPYSLAKQLRFWWWASTVWSIHAKDTSTRSGFQREMEAFPALSRVRRSAVRLQLLAISYLFALASFTIGIAVFLAKRVFDFDAPSPIRVLVNYLSALKLYNQPKRAGGGFLDALREPPRVSVRRRMMRVIADVASAGYDRWYIVAHSLGTVVAFNGLMETEHAWPNYLDQESWRRLVALKMAGRVTAPVGPTDDMLPARPLWLLDDDVVYRDRLFAAFDGLVTLGSPLNKFAAIWPARVPRNKLEALPPNIRWDNFFDPTDPVAGVLDRWFTPLCRPGAPPTFDLDRGFVGTLRNIGFRSHWMLLLSHIRYLKFDESSEDRGVAGYVADVLLGLPPTPSPRFFEPNDATDRGRRTLAAAQWILVAVIVAFCTWVLVPLAGSTLTATVHAVAASAHPRSLAAAFGR